MTKNQPYIPCARQLIHSLSLATGISHTLLVFSHDVWDEEINSLVRYTVYWTMEIQIQMLIFQVH